MSGRSLNSKPMISANTESESFLGVIGACRGISFRNIEGDGMGWAVGGPIDDLAGRRYCLDGVVGGRDGMGPDSSRNSPLKVVDEPFLARDLRDANDPFFGIVRSVGSCGRPYGFESFLTTDLNDAKEPFFGIVLSKGG